MKSFPPLFHLYDKYTDWYFHVKLALNSWNELNLFISYYSMFLWVWFTNILLRIFVYVFMKEIGL